MAVQPKGIGHDNAYRYRDLVDEWRRYNAIDCHRATTTLEQYQAND